MIRGLVLFYLNIKPTHGYEIQRFIQLSGMDQWAKIQSGSIYYALAKLEKEDNIKVLREEQTGSRLRKIYAITDKGRDTLKEEMRAELAAPMSDIGSTKMIIDPFLGVLDKKDMESIISEHIKSLEEKKSYWEKWKSIKAGNGSSRLSELSFAMTIHSLEDQIEWHQELLTNIDKYIEQSKQMKQVITSFEPDSQEPENQRSELDKKIEFVESIKNTLETDPQSAMESLNKLISEMKKNK